MIAQQTSPLTYTIVTWSCCCSLGSSRSTNSRVTDTPQPACDVLALNLLPLAASSKELVQSSQHHIRRAKTARPALLLELTARSLHAPAGERTCKNEQFVTKPNSIRASPATARLCTRDCTLQRMDWHQKSSWHCMRVKLARNFVASMRHRSMRASLLLRTLASCLSRSSTEGITCK